MKRVKSISRKARERAASLSALPLLLQATPNVPVNPNPNSDISPALMLQLLAADQNRRDMEDSTEKVRLEMEALQGITNKKKLLAERKLRQDRDKRLQKQSEDASRQFDG